MTTTDLAKRFNGQMEKAKWPAHLSSQIDFPLWAASVVGAAKYAEPIEGYISNMLAMQAIMADSIDAVFLANNVKGLQEILPDTPGATTGPHEILDIYVAESSMEKGQSAYVVVEWLDSELGNTGKWTTGATNIQATLIGLLKFGHWPIRCQVKRGDSKDKSGKYLMTMLPPD